MEGSISQALTIHAKCLYHGWFDGINMNLPRWRSISRTVQSPERNLPRWIPKSWKVPSQKTEPSTPSALYHGRFETIGMYIGGLILPWKYPVSGENVDFLRKKCRKICRVKKSAYICSPFEKQRWLRPTDDSADLRSLTTLRENKR